jgi:hypothetical protein
MRDSRREPPHGQRFGGLSGARGGVFFQDFIDDGEEWLNVERFGQVVSCAKDEQPLDLTGRGISAEDNNGNARGRRISLPVLNYLGPMYVRQVGRGGAMRPFFLVTSTFNIH